MGALLYDKNDFDGAIAEYKEALALNPKNIAAHIRLGHAYTQKGDGDSAIREFRMAKKMAPQDIKIRQQLGSMLVRYADAVAELQELEKMAPESMVCHLCLDL